MERMGKDGVKAGGDLHHPCLYFVYAVVLSAPSLHDFSSARLPHSISCRLCTLPFRSPVHSSCLTFFSIAHLISLSFVTSLSSASHCFLPSPDSTYTYSPCRYPPLSFPASPDDSYHPPLHVSRSEVATKRNLDKSEQKPRRVRAR